MYQASPESLLPWVGATQYGSSRKRVQGLSVLFALHLLAQFQLAVRWGQFVYVLSGLDWSRNRWTSWKLLLLLLSMSLLLLVVVGGGVLVGVVSCC